MSRRVKIFFTLSVLFNVFLVGLAGGAVLHKWQSPPFRHINEPVSPESRHLMARSFQRVHKDAKPDTDRLRRVQQSLKVAMEAETFDEGGFDKAVGQVKIMNDKMIARKVAMIKELFSELPQSERKKLSGRVIRSFSKHGKGHRRKTSKDNARSNDDVRQRVGPQKRP